MQSIPTTACAAGEGGAGGEDRARIAAAVSPIRSAIKAARALPSSGPDMYDSCSMPASRPRSSVGIVSFQIVMRNTPLAMSAAPASARHRRAVKRPFAKPRPTIAAPQIAAEVPFSDISAATEAWSPGPTSRGVIACRAGVWKPLTADMKPATTNSAATLGYGSSALPMSAGAPSRSSASDASKSRRHRPGPPPSTRRKRRKWWSEE